MRLLYITPYVPYPLNNGGNQAFFTLTDLVRREHDVSVLLFIHNSKDAENVQALKKLWQNVTFYLYESERFTTHADLDKAIIDSMPFWDRTLCRMFTYLRQSLKRKVKRRVVKYTVSSPDWLLDGDLVRTRSTLFMRTDDLVPGFCSYVQKIASKGFDAVQVEFYDYLPLVFFFPEKIKKVFVHHEIRFVRNENELHLFKESFPSDILRFEKEKAQEVFYLSKFDKIVTLTEIDKEILSGYVPKEKIIVSPAITHTVEFERKEFRKATELVFTGSGAHFPNVDAMVWFCRCVVPQLRKSLPAVPKINVVGQWDDDLKRGLQAICPELHFPGYVEDLQTFLNGKLSIVPVRIGSGMRMKILDSIFAATPMVTTSKGCEGLPMVDGENCLIADDEKTFAQAVCRLMDDAELQEKLANAAQHSKTNMLDEQELFQRRLSVYPSNA